jgi:hypothetical protein
MGPNPIEPDLLGSGFVRSSASFPNSDFLMEIDVMSDRWLSVEEIA